MRLKKETHTEEYYVYDCPLCGKETRWYGWDNNVDEGKPCSNCIMELRTLEQYNENKFLLGAVISAIRVGSCELDSFTITTRNSRKFRVSSTANYDDGSELEIEEEHD